MDVSKFLSKVLGLYLIIVSIMMITNMQQFTANVTSLINNNAAMFLTGFVTLILGLLMVVSHNVWQWNWRVIITLFSWIVLLKGLSLLLYPQFIDKTTVLFVKNADAAYIAGAFDFVLGVVLCNFGFKR